MTDSYLTRWVVGLLPAAIPLGLTIAIALTVTISLTLFATQAAAQGKRPVYKPVGAPPDAKVPAQWNRYYDYAQTTSLLKKLVEAHPNWCKLQSLGKSYGGRELWVLTVTNLRKGEADKKPGFWIDGSIHANEIQATEVVLYTGWYLLEMHDRVPALQQLLYERTFYLMPIMSPDSRDAHFYQPNTTSSPRTGQRPFDDDRDGLTDEDGPDDLDGDGHITQMRIRDPNGRYKPHQQYPQLLVRVPDDQQGEYTLLGLEGIDNDQDGKINEDGDGSYDPNRDWPWNWQPGYVQRGAGRYPLSVKANRLVAGFIMAHPNIAGAQSYHNTGGMILRGPGAKSDQYNSADLRVYEKIGRQGEELLPGYRYLNVANDLYEVYGGEFDWLYAMQGVFTFTNELNTPFNYFRKAASGFVPDNETSHKFDKYLLFGEGVVPWHQVQHPTYGNIEVGGFKKTWRRQVPSFLLEEECHRNMAFTLFHADQMPQVEVRSLQVEPAGGGLTQVTAVLANAKLTPTHAAVDIKHKITLPDRVSITGGPGFRAFMALTDDELLFRSPKEHTKKPEVVKLANIPGNSVLYVRWLVQGKGPYTVTINSVKGGTAAKTTGQQ